MRARGCRRHGRTHRRDERPVFFIFRARLDPAAERVLLRGGEFLLGRGRGHEFIGVGGENAAHQFALADFARDDGDGSALGGRGGGGALIEPEFSFARRLVRAVAFEAMARENGAHVAREVGRLHGAERGGQTDEEKQRADESHGRTVDGR